MSERALHLLRRWARTTEWLKRRSSLVASSFSSAVQVGVAAGAAWWVASVLLPWENPVYAPIGAVVAIGTGEDRMADRPLRIAGGMVAAVAVAGVVVGWLGSGVWQIMLITTITTVVGRFLFNDKLARTYSVFHGAVIAALGASRVIPEQLVEASLGAAIAIVIAYVILPPRIEPAVLSIVERAGDRARRSIQALASALRTGEPGEMQDSLEAARQVEAYLGAGDGRDRFARQVATLSPLRRPRRVTAERYIQADQRLTGLLLDAAAVARVAQPVAVEDPRPRPELSAAVDEIDTALAWLVRPPFDSDTREHVEGATERLRDHLTAAERDSDGDTVLREELRILAAKLDSSAKELTADEPRDASHETEKGTMGSGEGSVPSRS